MGLRNAMLFVKDLGGMTAFYSDVLGLTPNHATRLDNWVEFNDGGFSLHAIPPAIAADIQIESPPRAREQSGAKLTFEVEDVDGTLKKIEAMGLRLRALRGQVNLRRDRALRRYCIEYLLTCGTNPLSLLVDSDRRRVR